MTLCSDSMLCETCCAALRCACRAGSTTAAEALHAMVQQGEGSETEDEEDEGPAEEWSGSELHGASD